MRSQKHANIILSYYFEDVICNKSGKNSYALFRVPILKAVTGVRMQRHHINPSRRSFVDVD